MNSTSPRIVILMPTFNSARFLQEQVDSLLAQTHQNFLVVTRDDGSSDNSVALIEAYAEANPGRFHSIAGDGRNLGASGTFAHLLAHALAHRSEADFQFTYVVFCDHDDVWYPHKIAVTLARMQALEAQYSGIPLLVHSDLRVVDGERRQIAPSFVDYQGIQPHRNGLGRLLVCNTVTGCTAMINQELAIRMLPIPQGAIMHDWWMALVASAFGKIAYIDEALLDYRQHGENTLGAKEYRRSERPTLVHRLRDSKRVEAYQQMARQAHAFRLQHRAGLTIPQRLVLTLLPGLVKLLR